MSPTATISGARFVQPFEASRDIHTIAKNVIVVDDVVTLVDADGNSIRRLAETAVFCSVAPCWTATAQRIAAMTLRNSTRRRSLGTLYPAGCSLVLASTTSRERARRRSIRPPTAQPRLPHWLRSALAQLIPLDCPE